MSVEIQYTLVLGVYFALLLALGFYLGRRQGTRADYFIARGKLGPATVGFSYSATQMSGSSYMGAVGTEKIFGYGLSPSGVSSAAAPWFSYILLGDRLRRVANRVGAVTLADVLEARYYSRAVGTVATLVMLAAFIPLIAAQLKAAANVFEVLLGTPYLTGLFLFGTVVILYTAVGGMAAVAVTDLIQGIIMIAGFALLAPMAVIAAGGFSEVQRQYALVNPEGISFLGKMPALWVVSSFLVWGFFQIGGSPAAVTRFLVPEDDRTLKGAMAYSVFFQSFIYVCATLIAISAGVLLPNLENPDLTVPTLVAQLFPPVFGAVLVAAVLGATMSTIDSILLLSGSLVVENLYAKRPGVAMDTSRGLRIARIATFTIGALALLVAIRPPAAIFWIVTMAFSLMASAFTFPFLLGVWWRRATREGALFGMVGGAVSCIGWYVAGYVRYGSLDNWIGGIWPALLGPFVSLLLIVSVSLLTPPPSPEIDETFFTD